MLPKPSNQLTAAFITLITETVAHSQVAIQVNRDYIATLQPGQVVDQYRSLVITGPRCSGHSSVIKYYLERNPRALVLLPGKNDLRFFNYPQGQAFYWKDYIAFSRFNPGPTGDVNRGSLIFIDNWRTGVRSINLSDVFQVTERFNPAPFYVFLG